MRLIQTCALSLTLLVAQLSFADDPLVVTLEAHKVVRISAGLESQDLAERAKPNDLIEYRAVYKNQSSRTLHEVAATLPIPAGVEYISDSATSGALASLDGKSFSAVPLKHYIKTADGSTQLRLVPLHEYRFLRWHLGDLPANTSVTVTARARVADALRQQ